MDQPEISLKIKLNKYKHDSEKARNTNYPGGTQIIVLYTCVTRGTQRKVVF